MRLADMADKELKKEKKPDNHSRKGASLLNYATTLNSLRQIKWNRAYRIALTEKLDIFGALDDEIPILITDEHIEDEISDAGIFRESIHELHIR